MSLLSLVRLQLADGERRATSAGQTTRSRNDAHAVHTRTEQHASSSRGAASRHHLARLLHALTSWSAVQVALAPPISHQMVATKYMRCNATSNQHRLPPLSFPLSFSSLPCILRFTFCVDGVRAVDVCTRPSRIALAKSTSSAVKQRQSRARRAKESKQEGTHHTINRMIAVQLTTCLHGR